MRDAGEANCFLGSGDDFFLTLFKGERPGLNHYLEAIRYTNIGTVKTTVFWHETRLFCPDQITNPLFQGRHIVCVCMYAG